MSFAIVETGGKQYKVSSGDIFNVEKLPQSKDGQGKITFDKVLLIDDGVSTKVGTPYIDGAQVTADFIEEGKGKKITVIRYKAKVRYRKIRGHRQPYTKVKITSV